MKRISPITARLLALGTCCALSLSTGPLAAADIPGTTVLTHATVIDATGRGPIENATVIIDGNRIRSVSQTPYDGAGDADTRGDLEAFGLELGSQAAGGFGFEERELGITMEVLEERPQVVVVGGDLVGE